MSDQAQAAVPAQPATLTYAEAASAYAAAKAAGIANPVSEAARTLGQRGAQARQERLAQAQAKPPEDAQPPENEPSADSTPGATDDGVSPDATDPSQDEPAAQTIDLGEGVIVTADEVRERLMLKADHTRKTQELAEMRKGLEAERSQRLTQLDGIIGALQQKIGQPKTLKQWLADDPVQGLERFADQQEQMQEVNRAHQAKTQAEQHAFSEALQLRDKHLAESYNTEWSDAAKRDADYTKLSAFALSLGAKPEQVRNMTDPWMIQVLHKASQFDALKAEGAKVTKAIADKPQIVRPGVKVSGQAAQQNSVQQGMSRLKQTGSIADAAAVLGLRRRG